VADGAAAPEAKQTVGYTFVALLFNNGYILVLCLNNWRAARWYIPVPGSGCLPIGEKDD